jgi:hypothetical protein
MLQPYEYDPIDAAMGGPPWEHFTACNPDGTWPIVGIRVEERRCENGKLVNIVTHLQRPRDGVWQDLRGKFEGPPDAALRQPKHPQSGKKVEKAQPNYHWILPDGTRKNLTMQEFNGLKGIEEIMYMEWKSETRFDKPWFNSDKVFTGMPDADVAVLQGIELARYEIARIKSTLGALTSF